MPNIKSSAKRAKIADERRAKNKLWKSKFKSSIKNFLKLVNSGNKEEAEKALQIAFKNLDTAAKKGVIHKNKASRKKSRLQRKLNNIAS